jgi:hypothetical protein
MPNQTLGTRLGGPLSTHCGPSRSVMVPAAHAPKATLPGSNLPEQQVSSYSIERRVFLNPAGWTIARGKSARAPLGREGVRAGASRFAAEVLRIIQGIRASGVATSDGIAEALNARALRRAVVLSDGQERAAAGRSRGFQPRTAVPPKSWRCLFTSSPLRCRSGSTVPILPK